jgi:hypothetical protein
MVFVRNVGVGQTDPCSTQIRTWFWVNCKKSVFSNFYFCLSDMTEEEKPDQKKYVFLHTSHPSHTCLLSCVRFISLHPQAKLGDLRNEVKCLIDIRKNFFMNGTMSSIPCIHGNACSIKERSPSNVNGCVRNVGQSVANDCSWKRRRQKYNRTQKVAVVTVFLFIRSEIC